MRHLLAAMLLLLAGCRVTGAGLGGLECSENGECVEGYTCDEPTHTCVTTGDACVDEGRLSGCVFGATDCSDGCRTCTAGAWTDCVDVTLGDECTPNAVECSAGELVTCDGAGYIATQLDCGNPGCNDTTDPPRCNDCVPSAATCDGLQLTVCGADGLVARTENCETGSRCAGAGVCDAVGAACDTLALAPAGTPCDEGAGADGSFCNSQCDGAGACETTATPPSCDDGNECTGPDVCEDATGCRNPPVAAGTPCADGCVATCDATGMCAGPAVVCDDGEICTDDSCTPLVGCVTTNNSASCDDGDPCTTVDACDAGACVGSVIDPCDDSDPCTVGACITGTGCDQVPVDCAATATECREASSCDPSGAEGNCDVPGAPQNETLSCSDCASGLCLECSGGTCLDQAVCDGSALAGVCTSDADCLADAACVDGDCSQTLCEGLQIEHQLCSDGGGGPRFGAGLPCASVVCNDETSDSSSQAIGGDCYAEVNENTETAAITWTFETSSPSGTPFMLWMRIIADGDWDGGEQYDCSVDGVTGAGSVSWTFTEADLKAGRHGPGCVGMGTSNDDYCWAAADGDSDAATPDPIPLDTGTHVLTCSMSVTDNGTNEAAGFDGLLFTADTGYVPAEDDGPGACGDDDQDFTGGDCAAGWGPNVDWSDGLCTDLAPDAAAEGQTCTDCGGPGPCSVCVAGTCAGEGACDGASEPCLVAADCVALGGACGDSPDDCQATVCSGASFEHQACADSETGGSWGPGQPCVSVSCRSEDSASGDTAVGSDCYSQPDGASRTVTIEHRFNTTSAAGTLFNLWLRLGSDGDLENDENYRCHLTGVTGMRRGYYFEFDEGDSKGGRHGPGCAGYGNSNGQYCWRAVDGDADAVTWNPIPLDPGVHVLRCTISFSDGGTSESAGYDGIIFTNDLAFIPDEADGPGACGDRDTDFTEGTCTGNNWGPNSTGAVGLCDVADLPDGTLCSEGGAPNDTCCSGSCVEGASPGVCN